MEYDYEIISNKDDYTVMHQGKPVAAIECHDDWEQVSGAKLPDGAFEEIIHAIDANL